MSSPPMSATVRELTYLNAIVEAQREEMLRDERVILIGENIDIYGGSPLFDTFDARRLRNVPISENGFTGMGIGAALTGLRPIVDLTIASFVYLAADQIINQAAKLRYMTGGQLSVPIVFRACTYYNICNAAQHSDRPYPFFMNVPGLKIVAPATPADMKGLLKAAVRDDDPVLVFEDMSLWTKKEQVSTDPDFLVPIGKADVKRSGKDVTIVSIAGWMSGNQQSVIACFIEENRVLREQIGRRRMRLSDHQRRRLAKSEVCARKLDDDHRSHQSDRTVSAGGTRQ